MLPLVFVFLICLDVVKWQTLSIELKFFKKKKEKRGFIIYLEKFYDDVRKVNVSLLPS